MLIDGGTKSVTGQLLATSFQALTLELGLPGEVFSHEAAEYEMAVTDCWLLHTWKFCSKNNISVITGSKVLQPRRQFDQFLMEEFHRFGYRKKALLQLNCCRLFLQVTTVADVTTADGARVKACSWQGEKDMETEIRYEWPNQGKPTAGEWNQ